MPQPRAAAWVGLAQETTPGTWVAPADWIPVTALDAFDDIHYIPDKGLRGSAVETYAQIAAQGEGMISFGGDVFPESIPRILKGLMGELASSTSRTVADGVTNSTTLVTSATAAFTQADVGKPISGTGIPAGTYIAVVVSATNITLSQTATASGSGVSITIGVATLYSHNFTVLNTAPFQPVTYSVTIYNGFNTRGYPGVLFSDLSFKFAADGLLTYTCKGMGFLSAVQSGTTSTFNANPPIAAWNGTLSLAGVVNTKLESADLTISRPVAPINNIDAVQSPYKIWGGALSCKGKYVLIYEDDTDLVRYTGGTSHTALLRFATGTGATTRALQFAMAKEQFFNPTKPVWSKDYVELDVTWEGVANTTDIGASGGYGPVRATAMSLITAYTT